MHSAAAAVEPIVDETSYKAVCYKCHYVGLGQLARCPLCNFPIILETGQVNDEQQVEDIFDRVSVNVGAPPLPGLDGRPRKAQLLAEARKKRHLENLEKQAEAAKPKRRATTVSDIARIPRVQVTFAFVSAFLVGLLGAVASGGL